MLLSSRMFRLYSMHGSGEATLVGVALSCLHNSEAKRGLIGRTAASRSSSRRPA